MTRNKTASPERPRSGGSFVREPDGKLRPASAPVAPAPPPPPPPKQQPGTPVTDKKDG